MVGVEWSESTVNCTRNVKFPLLFSGTSTIFAGHFVHKFQTVVGTSENPNFQPCPEHRQGGILENLWTSFTAGFREVRFVFITICFTLAYFFICNVGGIQ